MRHRLARLTTTAALRIARPLYLAYYRFLFGRGTELEARLAPLVRRWERAVGMGDVPAAAETWDEEYADGRWSLLDDADESARFGVLCAYLRRLAAAGSVLDVGCGTGVLYEILGAGTVERFVGIDLSSSAIDRARGRYSAEATDGDEVVFRVVDAEGLRPEESFDAVVLNECLYYFHDPLEQARKYHGVVAPGGTLLVSMFETPRTRAIARRLRQLWPPITETRLTNRRGAWTVSAFPGP